MTVSNTWSWVRTFLYMGFQFDFGFLEALSLPPSSKQNYVTKVSQMKKRYQSSFREIGSLKLGLNGRNEPDMERNGTQKVDRYLQSLSKNNNKLSQAISIGNETENVARDIKIGLHSNTEKLHKTHRNVGRIQTQLSLSNKLIDVIRRNEMKNKIILYTVVCFLILAIVLIMYFSIFH